MTCGAGTKPAPAGSGVRRRPGEHLDDLELTGAAVGVYDLDQPVALPRLRLY